MTDPIGAMIRFVTFLFYLVGCFLGNRLRELILIIFQPRDRRSKNVIKAEKAQALEIAKFTDCRQAVLSFALSFGYMTRDIMSPQELEAKIASGIDAQELINELYTRMGKIPGIFLGQRSTQGGGTVDIKLPYSLRDRHCYIIGRSGSGKTNLIRTMIQQDIFFGCGVGVLAPEAELLTDELLPYMPENRIDDVVYVNPADSRHPIAFNPLHLHPGEDIGEKVEDFVTIFKRMVGDTGFRMDQILSETLYALIRRPGSTLDDIERFLSRTNPAFRNEVLRYSDEKTRTFFEETYPSMDKNAANPVLSRISAFTRREVIRNILCQPGRSFNFREAMDDGKVLLFNLSDGILGASASQLLGQIVISQLQLAAMSRADTPKAKRHPFYLYLDEFQTFTGVSEASYDLILSRARKYKLGLVLAHQQTGQISLELLKQIFGNVFTFIAFNISHDDATKLSHEFAYDYGDTVEYTGVGEFLRLRTGEAIGKIGRTVFPLSTLLAPQDPDHRRADYIIERSAQNYGKGNGGGSGASTGKGPTKTLPPPSQKQQKDIKPERVF